jgi:hypothetical protein
MKEKFAKHSKVRYLLFAGPCGPAPYTSTDLGVGGSNPSGRAIFLADSHRSII